ncbi:OB-fold nucleic acid binding domain-containing protein [Stetteria hydrogenophila]
MEERSVKVSDLKEGMDNVSVRVRVLDVGEEKVVNTRRGPRRISEATVGDETGRVKLTLWGRHAGTLKQGEAVEIRGGWTSSYRGEVQLNVGNRGEIERLTDEEVAPAEEVPENRPKAQSRPPSRTQRRQSGYGSFYSFRPRTGRRSF